MSKHEKLEGGGGYSKLRGVGDVLGGGSDVHLVGAIEMQKTQHNLSLSKEKRRQDHIKVMIDE